MATRNLVPRSGSEGSVGTNSKPWGSMIANIGHFNSIISASGDIIAFGDISSSISSTGSFGKLEIAGNSNFTGDVTIGGNINIGDADTDSLVISADLSSSLIPNDDSTYDLGTGAKNWRRGYVEKLEVTNITASGNIDFNGDLDVDGTTDLDATNVSLTLDVDGATTLDQVTINTTDGEFKVEGSNQVNIDSNIDIDNATTAIDTTTSTIITSPIINLVGDITGSANLEIAGNISGSVTSTGSFGRAEIVDNISIGGDILLDEDQRIYFEADKQTWMEANGANLVRIVTNNNQMLLLDHETGNRAVFGNGTKVFIGANNNELPSNELEVVGTISGSGILSIDGNITGSGNLKIAGNISGSASSTGSFGRIFAAGDIYATGEVSADSFVSRDGSETISFQDDVAFGADDSITSIQNITATGNISSSITSTGSFGYVTVAGLSNPNLIDFSSSLSTRITNDSSSFSTRITADSSSFSSRTTFLEGTGEIQSLGTTNNVLFANITASGDVIVQGKLTAQEIHTEIESASVIFTSGSTLFGNTSDDLHRFTGSVNVTENVSLQSDIIISGNITASNNISASGDILADGRIFEKGTSVIDHATAMSIVFGG